MPKITAIHSGGDWADASAEYVILPAGTDIETLAAKYKEWYDSEYRPALDQGKRPEYLTLADWLVDHGARWAFEDELEVFSDD